MRKMMLAVQHLHDKGIIHRDLKPDNFVVELGEDGGPPEIKLIDFGYAKRYVIRRKQSQEEEPNSPGL